MKTIVITGANSGIGKEVALGLAKERYKIIMVGRAGPKTDQVRKELTDLSGNSNIYIEPCDLSSLEQVKKLAEQLAAAKTPIYLAVSLDVEHVTGKCFYNAKEIITSKISYDKDLSQKLWTETEKIVSLSA